MWLSLHYMFYRFRKRVEVDLLLGRVPFRKKSLRCSFLREILQGSMIRSKVSVQDHQASGHKEQQRIGKLDFPLWDKNERGRVKCSSWAETNQWERKAGAMKMHFGWWRRLKWWKLMTVQCAVWWHGYVKASAFAYFPIYCFQTQILQSRNKKERPCAASVAQ